MNTAQLERYWSSNARCCSGGSVGCGAAQSLSARAVTQGFAFRAAHLKSTTTARISLDGKSHATIAQTRNVPWNFGSRHRVLATMFNAHIQVCIAGFDSTNRTRGGSENDEHGVPRANRDRPPWQSSMIEPRANLYRLPLVCTWIRPERACCSLGPDLFVVAKLYCRRDVLHRALPPPAPALISMNSLTRKGMTA